MLLLKFVTALRTLLLGNSARRCIPTSSTAFLPRLEFVRRIEVCVGSAWGESDGAKSLFPRILDDRVC